MESSTTDKISFVCSEGEYISVMSILDGANSIYEGIFKYFTTKDARELLLVCIEFNEAVKKAKWHDEETRIGIPFWPYSNQQENIIARSLDLWHMCFPNATAANVSERPDLVNADFRHFIGLKSLNISQYARTQRTPPPKATFTDAAFKNLCGIQKLVMNNCDMATITDEAFESLRGIRKLSMCDCSQPTITSRALMNLRGIEELDMRWCDQPFSVASLSMFHGIKSLKMDFENHPYYNIIWSELHPDIDYCLSLIDSNDQFWAIALDRLGYSILDYALERCNTSLVIKRMIQLGADVNRVSDRDGLTPLQRGCYENKEGIIESVICLLEAGADLNAKVHRREGFFHGATPLCFALRHKNEELIELLLHPPRGINPAIPLMSPWKPEWEK